ncbi:hypothetical protein [Actinoplanes sp. URMC 104]|uniref:hypothetical protein n=1 Tax=Actinoplanes sp. URMC 104 TaxID=3423409 RepID=UPI003F1A9B6C
MTAEHEHLRASLAELADGAEPADLYDRAVHRSRRIARREAAVGTGAAVLVLAVLGSGLWSLPHGGEPADMAAAAGGPHPAASMVPSLSSTATSPGASPTGSPRRQTASPVRPPEAGGNTTSRPRTAKPRSRTLADLPGHVFYRERSTEPDVVRMSPASGTSKVVLPDAPSSVGVSPDGHRIAYVSGGKLLVAQAGEQADAGGATGTEQVAVGVAAADQAPVWSPDGDRLLVHADAPGVLDLESGAFTPLPEQLAAGQHFRWSGDGSTLVYATSSCGLEVAAETGTSTSVPVLGDTQPQDNPDNLAACKATSVDATGQRVTVPLQTTGETAVGTDTADAVVDTATGKLESLPVAGTVVGAVFGPDGNLLVRTDDENRTLLSLFDSDNKLRVQAVEPPDVRHLDLLAYTR